MFKQIQIFKTVNKFHYYDIVSYYSNVCKKLSQISTASSNCQKHLGARGPTYPRGRSWLSAALANSNLSRAYCVPLSLASFELSLSPSLTNSMCNILQPKITDYW